MQDCFWRRWGALLVCLGAAIGNDSATAFDQPADLAKGVKVPDGFEVTLFADDDLAHDIYSMTIDSKGRVVVSGAGYVRILIDKDRDGRAESAQTFAEGPKSGAQGMFFDGRDLYCTGDAGVIRYRDRNGDDRADGPAELFLKMKTGSEHHSHAVRKGPDGWWYVVAGNFGGVDKKYVTEPASPIKNPEAGVVLRLTPDWTGGEVVAHGFRNAYDFDFNGQGDLFLYDSDGERAVSLPWYRPTRVFHVVPGTHAGWVSRSWKRPDSFYDMPPVVAEFGRGSPTGVCCYLHSQFPEQYRGAVFVADWTFGRVMAVPLKLHQETYRSEPVEFMTGVGMHGFAPTDMAVGSDGSLYVSVGGRGSRGGVYRVRWKEGDATDFTNTSSPDGMEEPLQRCLTAPQPLSSWSREVWMPLARRLGADSFRNAALDEDRPSPQRVRAIEILTELFGGLDESAARKLTEAKPAQVRARAAWSIGRTGGEKLEFSWIAPYLEDADPLVGRAALEALLGLRRDSGWKPLHAGLARRLSDEPRFNRLLAGQIVANVPNREDQILPPNSTGPVARRAMLAHAFGVLQRRRRGLNGVDPLVLRFATDRLQEEGNSKEPRLTALRLGQLALGDVGPREGREALFDGYASPFDFNAHEPALANSRTRLSQMFPTGDEHVDRELARLLAMLAVPDFSLADRLLNKIDDKSHPVEDIHYLIVIARMPINHTPEQQSRIAQALVALEEKIDSRQLNIDMEWDDRIGELYATLRGLSPSLPQKVTQQPTFGRPGHTVFLSGLNPFDTSHAIDAFARNVQKDKKYKWNSEVVRLLGRSGDPNHIELVRQQFDDFGLRDAVLTVLAKSPEPRDRELFVIGLESADMKVIGSCLNALSQLGGSGDADEHLAILRLIRRLKDDAQQYTMRDKAVALIRNQTGRSFGYVFGEVGMTPQTEVIEQWTDYFARRYPDQVTAQLGGGEELDSLRGQLAEVDWSSGDSQRGEQLFEKRACVRCHGGRRALGPDLAGAARRFSRDDLFIAVALPNRDVSPRYQTTLVQTDEGLTYTGLVIYESVDGLTLRDSQNRTYRFEADEIELKRTMSSSLMPSGLLKDLTPRDLADLYSYLLNLR